jgi:hypothetical protein
VTLFPAFKLFYEINFIFSSWRRIHDKTYRALLTAILMHVRYYFFVLAISRAIRLHYTCINELCV